MTGSEKQLALINTKILKERIIIAEGAFRTGKTLFLCFGFGELMIDQQENNPIFEGDRYAVAGQTNVTATFVNVTNRIVTWLQIRGYTCKKYNRWNYECTKKIDEENTVRFYIETFAIHDSKSYERLQGGTYRSVFLDEGPLMSEENIDNIMGRCATFPDHKVFITGNPEGPETHWFYQKYLVKNKNVYHIHFNMLDNPINKQETIDYYKEILSDSVFQKKVMGRWVATTGQCYPQMPNVVDKLPDEIDGITCGLDYGQVDATTCIAVAIKDHHYYIFDQYYHKNGEDSGENKTLIEYKTDIANFLNPLDQKFSCNVYLYCETSPSPVLPMLRRDYEIVKNIRINAVNKAKESAKSKSAIQERIEVTNMLINMGRLHIVGKDLPIYSAFSNAVYDKNGNRLDNGTSDIDSLDAFEYAIKVNFRYIMNNIFENAPTEKDFKQELEEKLNGTT